MLLISSHVSHLFLLILLLFFLPSLVFFLLSSFFPTHLMFSHAHIFWGLTSHLFSSFCPLLLFPYIPSLFFFHPFAFLSSHLFSFHFSHPSNLYSCLHSHHSHPSLLSCSLLFLLFSYFFIFSHACLSCHPALIFSNLIFSCPIKHDKKIWKCVLGWWLPQSKNMDILNLLCFVSLDGTHLNSSFFFLLLLHFNASFHQR